jgi:hypothetical protein
MTRRGENPPFAGGRPEILYILFLLNTTLHTLRRLHFTFIAFVAVLCLLGLQQGAAFHELSHLAGEHSTGSQKHLPHGKSCDKCVVYAEVSGTGPITAHSALQVPAPFIVIASVAQSFFPALTHPVYSARAPPAFL